MVDENEVELERTNTSVIRLAENETTLTSHVDIAATHSRAAFVSSFDAVFIDIVGRGIVDHQDAFISFTCDRVLRTRG